MNQWVRFSQEFQLMSLMEANIMKEERCPEVSTKRPTTTTAQSVYILRCKMSLKKSKLWSFKPIMHMVPTSLPLWEKIAEMMDAIWLQITQGHKILNLNWMTKNLELHHRFTTNLNQETLKTSKYMGWLIWMKRFKWWKIKVNNSFKTWLAEVSLSKLAKKSALEINFFTEALIQRVITECMGCPHQKKKFLSTHCIKGQWPRLNKNISKEPILIGLIQAWVYTKAPNRKPNTQIYKVRTIRLIISWIYGRLKRLWLPDLKVKKTLMLKISWVNRISISITMNNKRKMHMILKQLQTLICSEQHWVLQL